MVCVWELEDDVAIVVISGASWFDRASRAGHADNAESPGFIELWRREHVHVDEAGSRWKYAGGS